MSDLERLDEALAKFEAMTTPTGMYGYDHDLLVAAARAYRDLLANGQRWRVCETHDATVRRDPHFTVCDWWFYFEEAEGTPPEGDCRIVSKLLVDTTTEEER